MKSSGKLEYVGMARMGVRLLALYWIVAGGCKLAAVGFEFSQELDRLYWMLFFKVRAAGPLLELASGVLLALFSRRLAGWVARR